MRDTQLNDAWFDKQIFSGPDVADGCHPDEAKALKDYYHKKMTAKEAAHAIIQPVKNSENILHRLEGLWGLFIDALLEMPSEQLPALLELLAAIQQCPEPDRPGWSDISSNDGLVWRHLYHFHFDWGDHARNDEYLENLADCDPADRAQKRAWHIRKAEVEARLAAADIGHITWLGGFICVSDTLESSEAVLDFEVPAAAKWILFVGERLFKAAVDGEESVLRPRRHDLGWESKVIDLERWSFWENRMKEMTTHDSPIVRDAAKAAVERMKALRSSYSST